MSFLDALDESELWVGELRQVRLPCGRVLLLRTDAGVFAYEDRCPHLGLPLSAGTLEGDTLTCSAHQFQFDATTGQGKNPSCLKLRAYPVECKAGVIRVDVTPLDWERLDRECSIRERLEGRPLQVEPLQIEPCSAGEEERRGR